MCAYCQIEPKTQVVYSIHSPLVERQLSIRGARVQAKANIFKLGQSARLFSSRRNWDSPNPFPAGECPLPPWFREEGHTRWRERGWESPNSNFHHGKKKLQLGHYPPTELLLPPEPVPVYTAKLGPIGSEYITPARE